MKISGTVHMLFLEYPKDALNSVYLNLQASVLFSLKRKACSLPSSSLTSGDFRQQLRIKVWKKGNKEEIQFKIMTAGGKKKVRKF